MEGVKVIKEIYEKVLGEVSKVIVGKEEVIKLATIALLADGNIILEGVPGVAKTLIAKTFAKSLGLSFKRIQFTPDILPSDITGTFVFNPKERTFEFREGPIFANVILADEINRATPKTQSALLEAMQEKQVTVEGVTKALEEPFLVIATQNPVELEGTFPLPEAELDRFMFRVVVSTPTYEEEIEVLRRSSLANSIEVKNIADKKELIEAKELVKGIYVSQDILNYIVKILEATRRDRDKVILGGSPRASVHLLQASKALAVLQGRDYVIPDDVKALTFSTLNHRIILNPEYVVKLSSINDPFNYRALNEVINTAINSVEVPR
ncbi:MAG: MoxR family ATPase [Nitrososphaerales archaeon]